MAIYTERVIRVSNNKASMDKDIYIYRGNRNIEIQFTIVDHQFKFKDTNMVEKYSPSHAYVTLLTPQMKQIGTGKAEVVDGVIKLVVSSAMIDEKTECGEYSIVIDLYDEVGDSVLTIPPVENQLHVLDRMTEIDEIPDELRFVFDEQTGDLNVVNIDVTYDGNGEIRTIEGIPISDDKARKIMADLQETVEEFSANFDPALQDIEQAKEDIVRIDNTVTILSDNGYSQIKADMNQTQIQNVLNNGGLILFRAGTYNLEATLNMVSNTRLLAETRVELVMSGGNAISLDNISDVHVDGNLILNGAGFSINDCTDVVVNNLCVNAAENGMVIVSGDNIVVNNLVTQECSISGCRISNGSTPMNVVMNNHIDIRSNAALIVKTATSVGLAGRVHIINPFYELGEGSFPCVCIDNSINAPKVILDKPILQANVSKNVGIFIIKEVDNTEKLGNVEIIEPYLMGEGEVESFIKINNAVHSGEVARIKIIKPRCESSVSANVVLSDDVRSNKSVIVELDSDCEKEVSADMFIVTDIRNSYVMPEGVANNVTITLSGAPVNHVCEFSNKSLNYGLILSATNINNKSDTLELKYGDYVKLKHLGADVWVILDDNFKNKILTITPLNNILNVPNARYLYANVTTETSLVLPETDATFTEIHLFVTSGGDGAFVYPENIKWTNEEVSLESDCVFEFIFTKVNSIWLIGCVTYV